MFYETGIPSKKQHQVAALVALTPSESKRLIAKAIAKLPEVTVALKSGLLIIGRGSTNAYVAEEITGVSIEAKADEYCRGIITGGELRDNRNTATDRTIGNDFALRQGKIDSVVQPQNIINEFTNDDVFIKGANAVDSSGAAAVLVAGAEGGTVGWALPVVASRGSHLIVPVGLEKLIPSIAMATRQCGTLRFKYSMGLPCGLIPLTNGKVVTEIQALAVLVGISATHVASGGIGGSEGTVVLVLEGEEKAVDDAMKLLKAIKGEPPISPPRNATPPAVNFNYDSVALRATQNR